MASTAVVLGTLTIIALFILHVVGLATPHWYGFELFGVEIFHAGLFKVCYSAESPITKLLSGNDLCFGYGDLSLTSVDYYGFTALTCIAALLYFITSIIGLVGCCNSNRPGRPTVQNLSGMAFGAGGCAVAGVAWFAARYYNDTNTFNNLALGQAEIKLQYSVYLCAVSGGLCLVFAITMCIVGQNMQSPAVVTTGVINPGPQVTVLHHQQQAYNPATYQQPVYHYGQTVTAAPV